MKFRAGDYIYRKTETADDRFELKEENGKWVIPFHGTSLKLPMGDEQLSNYEKYIPQLKEIKNKYQLDEKGNRVLEKFLTFAKTYKNLEENGQQVFYNLLVIADDIEEGVEFAKDINDQLLKEELCQNVSDITDLNNIYAGAFINTFQRGPKQDIAILKNCLHVKKDSSAIISSSERSQIQQERAEVEEAYQHIMEQAEKNPDRTLILCVDTDFSEYIKEHEQWYRCYFSHHIRIPKKSIDCMVSLFKEDMQREGFTVTGPFVTEYKKYLNAVYLDSRLGSKTFLKQFENKVLSNYYDGTGIAAGSEGTKSISVACMPYYQKPKPIEETMKTLRDLTGLKTVKEEMNKLYLSLSEKEGKKEPIHFSFEGNPGTGKTMVAELMSNILFNMGVCRKDKCITVKSSDIMSVYVGGSVNLLSEKIAEANGGVLFIDEAYFLAQDKNHSKSGLEGCLELLLKCMDDPNGNVCFIFAGYPKDMQRLYKSNAGLSRRLRKIRFENYTTPELKKIFEKFCKEENMKLADDAGQELEQVIEYLASQKEFGNAADMRNLRDSLKAILLQKKENKKLIEIADLKQAGPKVSERVLNEMVGLKEVKETFALFKKRAEYLGRLKEEGMEVPFPHLHMIFRGNPGTGKTTLAKKIANELYQDHLLKSNRVTVVERKDLVSNSVGGTAIKTGEVIEEALNGVLFIDEAYSLARGDSSVDPGREAIETLITAMETHVHELAVIFAGYPREMEEFLWINPGIRSRIGFTFNFNDYSADELTEMFNNKMVKSGFTVTGEALDAVKKLSEYFKPMDHFGNGRFIDSIVDLTISDRSRRPYADSYNDITDADIPTVKEVMRKLGYPDMDRFSGENAEMKEQEFRRRVIIHELGHYFTAIYSQPPVPVSRIEFEDNINSNGRVILDEHFYYHTNLEAFSYLTTLLGGRNSEELFLHSISDGDASDYAKAIQVAKEMIEDYAMCGIGEKSPVDLLREASDNATRILKEHREDLLKMLEEHGYAVSDLMD